MDNDRGDGSGSPAGPEQGFHHRSAEDTFDELGSDAGAGLTQDDAASRLREVGPNELGGGEPPSKLRIMAEQLTDVLVVVLLVAAAISGLVLARWLEAAVILVIVVLNAGLGYVQESRAEQALAELRELAAPGARVLRAGSEADIPAREVVPGDVLILEPGERVAADARIVDADRLAVDEAVLTGESFEVRKQTDPVEEDEPLGERASMVFMGTGVASGRGRAVVSATGDRTEMGGIARMLGGGRENTPLQRDLDRLGKRLTLVAVGTASVLFLAGIFRGFEVEELFLVVVALAVAAIPEGLPAVVTVALARGVSRMASRGAIVRQLPAVEALGRVDVIASDKTRTLTRGRIRVVRLATVDGVAELDENGLEDPVIQRYVDVAALCNDAQRDGDELAGDSTDVAMLVSAEDLGANVDEMRERADRVRVSPFDGRRKRMTTLHRRDDVLLLLVKGAPEILLERTAQVQSGDGSRDITDGELEQLGMTAQECAAEGLRVLGTAYRELQDEPDELDDAEHELVFVALAAMRDEIRDGVPEAIEEVKRAGARVVMVTGDHPATADAIARQLGLVDGDRETRHGRELGEREPEDLAADIDAVGAYARVDPRDKLVIVEAWKHRGATVAMTGDGVNDAPALQAADIGVAMGSGTEVAKGAADLVLTDDNFATIVAAMKEGRRIFENLVKAVHFLLSANLAEILVVSAGVLVFGRGEPLLATQLLWVNLITDGMPVMALALDPAAPDVMDRPPVKQRDFLNPRQLARLCADAGVLGAATLAALVYAGHLTAGGDQRVQTLTFTTLALVQFAQLANIRSGTRSPISGAFGGNRLLIVTVLASVALQVLLVQTPVGGAVFDTVPLGLADWAVAAGLVTAAFTGLLVLRWRLGATSRDLLLSG